MKKSLLIALFLASAPAAFLLAQPPRGDRGPEGEIAGSVVEESVARLMAFDKNEDGKLESDELGDSRLRPLAERADVDKDKVVTREELTQLFAKEAQSQRGGRGPGGPGDHQHDERGPGGMRPGLVLPEFMQEQLQLNEEQRTAMVKLQATVDAELAKILNAEQQQHLKQMAQGPRGGRRGFGGPPGERRQEDGKRPPAE